MTARVWDLAGMAWIAVRQRLQYRFDFFMTLLTALMFGALSFMIWSAIYSNNTDQALPWQQLITYIMVGQAINLSRWSAAERTPVYSMDSRIRNLDIALDLIRPVDFHVQRFAEAVGFFIVELIWVNIPALLVFIFFLKISPPANAMAAAGFFFSLVIAFLVSFSLNSIVMMTTFWTTNALGAQIAKKAIVDVLAGLIIPFEFFPGWLTVIVTHLPFKGMAYIPLSIYTGKISGESILWSLLEQIIWAVIMLAACRLMWNAASRRITINGG